MDSFIIKQMAMKGIVKICESLCPCFFISAGKDAYTSQISQAQNQSFASEIIENNIQLQQNSPKNKSNLMKTQQTSNDFDDQNLIQKNHEDNSLIDEEQQQEGEQQSNQNSQFLKYISPQNPYYELLQAKIQLLPKIFDLGVNPQPKVPDTPYGLKIFTKQAQDDKSNIFVYTFVFPTTFGFYEHMQNNFELQKSFDGNIDKYDCREIIDEATKIIYLSYKKILIISPRDFVYVRYTFQKDKEYWSIATSLNQQPIQGKTRGNIILTVTKAVEKDQQLYLSVYSQIDMKMGIKATGTKQRGITQIKKYLDKCYAHIQEQKNNIL